VSYGRGMSGPQVERFSRWAAPDLSARSYTVERWLVSVGIIGLEALTVHPLGRSGRGLLIAVLLVVNCLFLLLRHISETVISSQTRFVLLGLGAIAAAALLAAVPVGETYLFAFFVAGHAGYRLTQVRAAEIAVTTSVLCTAVLLYRFGLHNGVWTVGATTGLAVLIGMIRRTRQNALDSALLAAAAAERAIDAEARSAVLAERSRIARDVHDVLAHSLAGINMQLELVDALLDTGDLSRVREATGRAQNLVQESLKQAQWTVTALREDALPLLDTLIAMLDSSGLRDSLTVVGVLREISPTPTQNLLRIAQEGLTNAARHAPGASVKVTLCYNSDSVALEIRNDRAARPPTGEVGSGLGLVGMRERVALLAGTLAAGPITSGPAAGGWRVEAVIPA